ncbi:MAG: hypothetical protein ABI995_08745, partial [Acidobacteriota bacterium]
RKKEKASTIIQVAGFDDWMKSRPKSERKVAQRLIKVLVDDEALDSVNVTPLLEIVKSSVETVAFRELLEHMEEQRGKRIHSDPVVRRLADH